MGGNETLPSNALALHTRACASGWEALNAEASTERTDFGSMEASEGLFSEPHFCPGVFQVQAFGWRQEKNKKTTWLREGGREAQEGGNTGICVYV